VLKAALLVLLAAAAGARIIAADLGRCALVGHYGRMMVVMVMMVVTTAAGVIVVMGVGRGVSSEDL
jgi:hypothetical protein